MRDKAASEVHADLMKTGGIVAATTTSAAASGNGVVSTSSNKPSTDQPVN